MNKTMVKDVILAIILLILVIMLITFDKQDKNIEINIEELGVQIVESGAFQDDLAIVDSTMIMKDYNFSNDEIKQLFSYQGTGATSEGVIILQVNDKEQINMIEDKIKIRINEKIQAFEGYLPKEVFKLENNVLEIKGNYVIFCVSNDSKKVEEVINKYC